MSITDDVVAAPSTVPATGAGVSVSVRGPHDAVLAVSGDVGPAVVRLVEVMLGTVLVDGVRHVIADLSAASGAAPSLCDVLTSMSRVLERRGGWLLVEGGAAIGWTDGGGDAPTPSLLDAFRAYRAAVER